jgi:hypothetical protein
MAMQVAQSCFTFDPFGFLSSLNINLSRAVAKHLAASIVERMQVMTAPSGYPIWLVYTMVYRR